MENVGMTQEKEERLYRSVFWRLIPILFISYLIAYLDRVNIGFAKLQMLDDLGFSNEVYALGASIFFLGYCACETPSNILMYRLGARVWISRIMVTWGTVSLAMAFTGDIAHGLHVDAHWVFYALRLLTGVFEAGFFPGVVLYLNYWYPTGRQSQVLSKFMLALPVSLALGGPLSGGVMTTMERVSGLASWQWLFILEAAPALILGVIVFFTLPSRIQDARWLTPADQALLDSRLSLRPAPHKKSGLRQALVDRNYWLMIGIVLATNTGFYGLSFWLPTIIHNAGIRTPLQVGLVSAIPYAAAAIAMYLNGAHSRRTRERRLHMAIPMLIGGAGMILSALFAGHLVVSIGFISIAAAGLISMMPIIWSVPGSFLAPACLAAGIGLINTVGQLGGILGAYISNLAGHITGDVGNGTYVLGFILVSAGILTLSMSRACFDETGAGTAEPGDIAGSERVRSVG